MLNEWLRKFTAVILKSKFTISAFKRKYMYYIHVRFKIVIKIITLDM